MMVNQVLHLDNATRLRADIRIATRLGIDLCDDIIKKGC